MATRAINQLSRIGQRRQVVIPRAICRQLKLAAGDLVQIEEREDVVLIRPRRQPDREEVLTSREAAAVRRGMKEFEDGKSVAWRDLKLTNAG